MPYDPEARRDTPLALKLKERIRREGPIPLADYMRACLTDAEHGYYVRQPAIGRAGDFITAPEISQVFGELLGLWSAVVWQQMGAPERVALIELGPGRGTLMRDALRAAGRMPAFLAAAEVHLIETNGPLAARQRDVLADVGPPVTWHAALATVPPGPSILIANEFLDTLPLSQQIRVDGVWRQRGVALDESGRLVFASLAGAPATGMRLPDAGSGSIVEGHDYAPVLREVAARSDRAPAAALFVDYGHTETAAGDTLQAVRGHVPEHPLSSPGEADLTAQVDFAAVKAIALSLGLAVDGPVAHGEFLGRLGIVERASRLMSANPGKAGEIEMAVARLIAPQGMGSRFKVLGLRPKRLPVLPGFESAED